MKSQKHAPACITLLLLLFSMSMTACSNSSTSSGNELDIFQGEATFTITGDIEAQREAIFAEFDYSLVGFAVGYPLVTHWHLSMGGVWSDDDETVAFFLEIGGPLSGLYEGDDTIKRLGPGTYDIGWRQLFSTETIFEGAYKVPKPGSPGDGYEYHSPSCEAPYIADDGITGSLVIESAGENRLTGHFEFDMLSRLDYDSYDDCISGRVITITGEFTAYESEDSGWVLD